MRREVGNEPSLEVHRLRVLGAVQAAPMRYLCYRVAMRYLRQGDTKVTARPQDVALLPLPPWGMLSPNHPSEWYTARQMADYARANVTAALASAQAREEELREEVDSLRSQVSVACEAAWQQSQYRVRAQERAERLEEALRAAMNEAEGCMFEAWLARTCPGGDVESVHRQWEASSEFEDFLNEWSEASAALSTNAATQTGETNEAAE